MRVFASAAPSQAPSRGQGRAAIASWLPGLVVGAVALAFWPGVGHSFSTPKTVVLAAGALAFTGLAVLRRDRLRYVPWPALAVGLALAFAAAVGPWVALPQLALHACAVALLIAGCAVGVDARRLALASAWAGTGVSVVVVLQAGGVDLLAAFSPQITHSRLHVYGTLGNPDFVAAFVGATLWPAIWAWRQAPARIERLGWLAAVLLHAGALAATRSFASLLALLPVVGVAFWVARRGRPAQGVELGLSRWAVVAVGLGVAALLAASVQGRSLDRLAAGRLHLWRVAAPAVLDAPLLGHGPGAVEALWPAWQVDRAEATLDAPDFAALQNHAHNDYLERALEQGLFGLLALLALVAAVLRQGLKAGDPAVLAIAGAVASLAVRATVDFPLSRPAELALFMLAAAAVFTSSSRKEPS